MNAPTLAPGTTLGGRWQVGPFIGAGELGEVYAVRDPLSGQTGALKRFSPQLLGHAGAWAAFDKTAQAVAALPFDVFAKRIDSGTDGAPWVVTDRVVWPSLAEQVRAGGTLPVERMAAMLDALAPALDAAHAAGLVHRGLKPGNVFVEPAEKPTVHVTDFGAWRLRAALGIAPGWAATPGWLGPDAADPAEASTPRMDVFSLGLVIFHALTGHCRFSAAEREPVNIEALWLQMLEPIGSASALAAELGVELDRGLDDWLARALAPRPEERFESVGAMAARFRSAAQVFGGAQKNAPRARPIQKTQLGVAPPPVAPPANAGASPAAASPPAASPAAEPLPAKKRTLLMFAQGPDEPPPSGDEQHEPVAMVSAQPLAYLRVPTRPPPADVEAVLPATAAVPPTVSAPAPATMAPGTMPAPATVPMPPGAAARVPMPGQAAAVPIAAAPGHPLAATLPTAQAAPTHAELEAYGVPKKRGAALPIAIGGGVIALGGLGLLAFHFLHASPAKETTAGSATVASASRAPARSATAPVASGSADAGTDAAPQSAIVHFVCDPACDRIECDGQEVKLDAGAAPLDPGPHRCTGTRHGYLPSNDRFQADPGQDVTRRLKLTKLMPHPQPAQHPATTHKKKTCGTFINPCK